MRRVVIAPPTAPSARRPTRTRRDGSASTCRCASPRRAFAVQVVAPSGFVSRGRVPGHHRPRAAADRARGAAAAVTAVEWLPLRGRLDGRRPSPDRRPSRGADRRHVRRDHHPCSGRQRDRAGRDRPGRQCQRREARRLPRPGAAAAGRSVGDARPGARRRRGDRRGGRERRLGHEAGGAVHPAGRRRDRSPTFCGSTAPSQSYRSTFVLPQGMQGPVALRDVELEDYAGNKTKVYVSGKQARDR